MPDNDWNSRGIQVKHSSRAYLCLLNFIDKTFPRLAQWLLSRFGVIIRTIWRAIRRKLVSIAVNNSIIKIYISISVSLICSAKINSSSENSADNWTDENFLTSTRFLALPETFLLFCCLCGTIENLFCLFIKCSEEESLNLISLFWRPLHRTWVEIYDCFHLTWHNHLASLHRSSHPARCSSLSAWQNKLFKWHNLRTKWLIKTSEIACTANLELDESTNSIIFV